jgi:hypothetical protein
MEDEQDQLNIRSLDCIEDSEINRFLMLIAATKGLLVK